MIFYFTGTGNNLWIAKLTSNQTTGENGKKQIDNWLNKINMKGHKENEE